MRKAFLILGVVLLGWGLGAPADALPQRRINALAACLLQTHLALVEEPGIRRPDEPLPGYFGRLLALQPGEKPSARRTRIAAYLALLGQTVDRTADLRRPPALHQTSPANRALWQQISLNMSDVSAYLVKARATWAREGTASGPPTETAKAVAQAIWHIQNAYAALRDVIP